MAHSATPGGSVPRERPLRADARRNREAILKAARAVFAEQGREAQIDDVARRAKVGVGTVYRHFPTKEALLEALAAAHFARVAQIARDALEVEDPWEAFAGMLEASSEQFARDRALSEIAAMAPDAMASTAVARADLREAAEEVMRRAQQAGQLRPDARIEDLPMLLCGISSAMHSPACVPGSWRRHLRIVLDGLRADAVTERL